MSQQAQRDPQNKSQRQGRTTKRNMTNTTRDHPTRRGRMCHVLQLSRVSEHEVPHVTAYCAPWNNHHPQYWAGTVAGPAT
eukprot:686707-Pyramimonas_sp.AAC.1